MILEDDGGRNAINPDKFDKLITSLRTAVDDDEVLDKEATSYNDIVDAFRLALKFYHFEDSGSVQEFDGSKCKTNKFIIIFFNTVETTSNNT